MKLALLFQLALSAAAAADLFDNIPVWEKALVPAGFPVAKWQPVNGQSYASSQIILPNTKHAVISYAFAGPTANRVTRANISTLVNAPTDAPSANAKLADVTAQWFKSVGRITPNGLLAAIRASNTYEATAGEIKAKVTRQGDDIIVRLEPK